MKKLATSAGDEALEAKSVPSFVSSWRGLVLRAVKDGIACGGERTAKYDGHFYELSFFEQDIWIVLDEISIDGRSPVEKW